MSPKTPRELRRFGFTVGGVFGVLAAISWWRGHVIPPAIMGALAVLLIAPALVFPGGLRPVERRWMEFAGVLGHVNSRIILTILYYGLVTPLGVVRRSIRDPLDRRLRDGRSSDWIRREPETVDLERYEQQF